MKHLVVPLSFLVPLLAAPAWSQQAAPGPAESHPWISIWLEQRTRFEKLTHPFRLDQAGPTRLLALRTRLQAAVATPLEPLRLYAELEDARGEWKDGPFPIEAQHVNQLDIQQLGLSLSSDRWLGSLSTGLQLGRMTMDLGSRRLLARNGMRNTTNSFDGVSWWLGRPCRFQLRTFFTRPVTLKPRQPDTSSNDLLLWGADLQLRRWRLLGIDGYYLGVHEGDETVQRRRYTTLGLRLFKEPAPGEWDYEVESDWQLGSDRGRDHLAHFQHAQVGHVLDLPSKPRLSLHFDYASGDQDPDDDRSGRFNTLFGARRFELNPTGIYGPFYRSNLLTPGLRGVATPSRRLEVMAFYRAFWLAEARDAWAGSGLQDPSGASGRFLGHQVESRVRFKATSLVGVELGYAHLFKGSFLDRIPGSPGTADSDYFYAALELRTRLLER
jgi:hypothetical protein